MEQRLLIKPVPRIFTFIMNTDSILDTRYSVPNGDPIKLMVDAKAVLAPMSGITDVPFRTMCRKFGCRFAFTEMIDVNGIVYKNRKSLKYLERTPGDYPLGAQIVGADEDRLLYVAELCEEKGFDILDINAGCPAPKVIKGDKGSALLKDPKRIKRIVGRIAKKLSIPVTVKIRSGWDEENLNYLEIAKIAEAEGARAICIHPRTRGQMYKGKAEHDFTREVKESVSIPVFASGDVFSGIDAKEIIKTTGCDGVFVARGSLGKPWIFKDIDEALRGGKDSDAPALEELKKIIEEHYILSLDFHGEFLTHKRMYKHLAWYLKRYKNINEIMNAYREAKGIELFREFLSRLSLDGRRLVLAK